jgi:hypothetical protein
MSKLRVFIQYHFYKCNLAIFLVGQGGFFAKSKIAGQYKRGLFPVRRRITFSRLWRGGSFRFFPNWELLKDGEGYTTGVLLPGGAARDGGRKEFAEFCRELCSRQQNSQALKRQGCRFRAAQGIEAEQKTLTDFFVYGVSL